MRLGGTSAFGSNSNNAAGSTGGGLFGAPKPATTGFGGFGQPAQPAQQQQPATGGLFGGGKFPLSRVVRIAADDLPFPMTGAAAGGFGAANNFAGPANGTASAPYQPTQVLEPPAEEGKPPPASQTAHNFQSITCMPQYKNYSFEVSETMPCALRSLSLRWLTSTYLRFAGTPSSRLSGEPKGSLGDSRVRRKFRSELNSRVRRASCSGDRWRSVRLIFDDSRVRLDARCSLDRVRSGTRDWRWFVRQQRDERVRSARDFAALGWRRSFRVDAFAAGYRRALWLVDGHRRLRTACSTRVDACVWRVRSRPEQACDDGILVR